MISLGYREGIADWLEDLDLSDWIFGVVIFAAWLLPLLRGVWAALRKQAEEAQAETRPTPAPEVHRPDPIVPR